MIKSYDNIIMSFPQFKDILKQHMNAPQDAIEKQSRYINRRMEDYYKGEIKRKIINNISHIANNQSFAVFLEKEDMCKLNDRKILCDTMNNFLNANGYEVMTMLVRSIGSVENSEWCEFTWVQNKN